MQKDPGDDGHENRVGHIEDIGIGHGGDIHVLVKTVDRQGTTVNAIAPTGTLSIIAGCSAGIEPLFAIRFVRNVLSAKKWLYINPLFEEAVRKKGLHDEEVFSKIARHGSLQSISGIPGEMKRIFLTAFDVTPRQHLKIQSTFQKYTDNAVSKTINLPWDATVEDVRQIYLTAHKSACKGITVYRYGSRKNQTLLFDYPPGCQLDSIGDMGAADS